jgi:hypothetical protein
MVAQTPDPDEPTTRRTGRPANPFDPSTPAERAGLDLTGTPIIVTGAARGMGAATVRAHVRSGAHVVAMDVNDTDGQRVVEAANGEGPGRATYLHIDVADTATSPHVRRRRRRARWA